MNICEHNYGITYLVIDGVEYRTNKKPELPLRNEEQLAYHTFIYRPHQIADRATLQYIDENYTWLLTDEQIKAIEKFISEFSPDDAIEWPTLDVKIQAARQQRDALLNKAEARISRYDNQVRFGITPTDTPETIQKLGIYMQALRDVPEQPGFPRDINWPVEVE